MLSFKSSNEELEVKVFSDMAESMEMALFFADIKLFELGYDLELPFDISSLKL